ncbi:DNA phosphorothioation-dependent restriction protein DptF [Marinobacter halodurans]|uniref:DNA phosphorothioation-dependent restriction protein DptF n=1 Tax=Marinobacter halodurans TaxID=2528979 RepID=UPI0013F17BD4|nr:DNA phosphorothioation-dependent restriction protein DptF [Marinobacter halodurans]
MQFKRLLDTLARSSAQAVTTLGKGEKQEDELKDYLYVETDIETDFKRLLDSSPPPETVIFLCGSSGDGKSEILKRYHKRYSDEFSFHLDATHAFKPDQNAIQALDQLFEEHKSSEKPLVVGINVGMLFNFSSQGDKEHEEIRNAIEAYLQSGEEISPHFKFLNFEKYPKFSLEEGKTGSVFIFELIERVVAASDANPLYRAYLESIETSQDKLTTNYRLLQIKEVRERIVKLLLSARLRFDQFLSARALLDFVHHLITGPGLLCDNLFVSGQNELSEVISHFDPCSIRSRRIDQFLIQHPLGVKEQAFEEFQADVASDLNVRELDAASWLRFFYLLQDVEIGNNFHQTFGDDFEQPLYNRYIEIWRLHATYDGGDKTPLRDFYKDELFSALMRFGNRLEPSLTKRGHMFLCSRNKVFISAHANLRPDFKGIEKEPVANIHEFPVCIKVGDQRLRTFYVNVSFLELISKINNGYRPNKHDKNTIVILEEIIADVTGVIVNSNRLLFSEARSQVVLTNEVDDEEFVVGGEE